MDEEESQQEQRQAEESDSKCKREMAVPAFSRFGELPTEIRHLIWEFSVPDDEPEVHHLWNFQAGPDDCPTVDIAWPAAMHTCHDGRVACSRRLMMRKLPPPPSPATDSSAPSASSSSSASSASSQQGGRRPLPAQVPCRPFRPDLDVLHMGHCFSWPFFHEPPNSHYEKLGGVVRHLSVDQRASVLIIKQAVLVLPALETLIIHVSRPGEANHDPKVARLPRGAAYGACYDGDLLRRVRPRRLTAAEAARTTFVPEPIGVRTVQTLRTLLDNLDVSLWRLMGEETQIRDRVGLPRVAAWDYETLTLRVRFEARAFEEKHTDGAGRPEWRLRDFDKFRRVKHMLTQLDEMAQPEAKDCAEEP